MIWDKLIWIDNCTKDEQYKFEYNNICYESCPKTTQISSDNYYLCENDLRCKKYYNYEHIDCLETIPEGYYLNNSKAKTIDKCNIKCKSCSLESTYNDLCLSCNINGNYYPKYNG